MITKPSITPVPSRFQAASTRLIRFIQWGLIILVALMPFHAFLSVWFGHLIGHQAIIQAWKEVLLLGLSGIALTLIIRRSEVSRRLYTPPVILIGAFALIAVIITVITQPLFTAIIFGAKTDFEFLLAFILACLVATPVFIRRITSTILISGTIVIGFGLLQVTILPSDFLTLFGYSPATIPPYLILDPAVHSLRFGSTLGGPNQLGTYLMLPLALGAIVAVRRRQWPWLAVVTAGALVSLHTYSRSAWLGTFVAAIIVILALTPRRHRLIITAALAGLTSLAALIASRLIQAGGTIQYYLLHSSSLWHQARGSDFQHLTSLQDGLNRSLTQPLGHGLGTAGPATFHAGSTSIIENNYLQLSYETGLIGAGLFIAIIVTTLHQLARQSAQYDLSLATLAAITGISVTAVVLPAWTDSTTALVVWTAAGSIIGLKKAADSHV